MTSDAMTITGRSINTPDLFTSAPAKTPAACAVNAAPASARMSPQQALEDVQTRALLLMADLGQEVLGASLVALGWAFRFDRAKTRLGCCTYSVDAPTEKSISVSRHFAGEWGWQVMEDVVRHEIAHAVDVETRGHTDHGRVWRSWARRCGADPKRLYEGQDPKHVKPKYVAECPSCGAVWPYHRRSRQAVACLACCRQFNGGLYSSRYRLLFCEATAYTGRQLKLFPDGGTH